MTNSRTDTHTHRQNRHVALIGVAWIAAAVLVGIATVASGHSITGGSLLLIVVFVLAGAAHMAATGDQR